MVCANVTPAVAAVVKPGLYVIHHRPARLAVHVCVIPPVAGLLPELVLSAIPIHPVQLVVSLSVILTVVRYLFPAEKIAIVIQTAQLAAR